MKKGESSVTQCATRNGGTLVQKVEPRCGATNVPPEAVELRSRGVEARQEENLENTKDDLSADNLLK